MTDTERLIVLARRLLEGAYSSDAEVDADMREFKDSVPHPRASDLIYYWQDEFDQQPTAEEVVAKALAYRAIEL